MTRTVGIILIAAAIVIGIAGVLWLVLEGSTTAGGAALGLVLLLVVIVGPLAAGGVIALTRGRKEEAEQSAAQQQRKILDMVRTRGQVHVSDMIVELQSDLPTVQAMIYRLVGMGVFSGYVKWDEGILYSAEAASLREMENCRNCGGQLKLAGKGVIKCPYCGTEYFLP